MIWRSAYATITYNDDHISLYDIGGSNEYSAGLEPAAARYMLGSLVWSDGQYRLTCSGHFEYRSVGSRASTCYELASNTMVRWLWPNDERLVRYNHVILM